METSFIRDSSNIYCFLWQSPVSREGEMLVLTIHESNRIACFLFGFGRLTKPEKNLTHKETLILFWITSVAVCK